MPNIPDIRPDIQLKRHDVLNMLLASIAMEEMGLSHLINAESEQLKKIAESKDWSTAKLLRVNDSVERMMRNVIKNQMLLQFKLEDVMKLESMSGRPVEEECEE